MTFEEWLEVNDDDTFSVPDARMGWKALLDEIVNDLESGMVDQWHRAQKAMADDIIDMLQRHTKHVRFAYGTRERLSTGFLFEIKKYLKEVVKDDQRI